MAAREQALRLRRIARTGDTGAEVDLPAETFSGRIEKGFDMTVAGTTLERFVGCALRLYEKDRVCAAPWLEAYVRRWRGWATATR